MRAIAITAGALLALGAGRAWAARISTDTARMEQATSERTSASDDTEDFERKAGLALRDLRDELDESEDEAMNLSAEARHDARKHVAELRRKRDEAEAALKKLRASGEVKARKARVHIDRAIDSLWKEYEALKKDLDDKEKSQ